MFSLFSRAGRALHPHNMLPRKNLPHHRPVTPTKAAANFPGQMNTQVSLPQCGGNSAQGGVVGVALPPPVPVLSEQIENFQVANFYGVYLAQQFPRRPSLADLVVSAVSHGVFSPERTRQASAHNAPAIYLVANYATGEAEQAFGEGEDFGHGGWGWS